MHSHILLYHRHSCSSIHITLSYLPSSPIFSIYKDGEFFYRQYVNQRYSIVEYKSMRRGYIKTFPSPTKRIRQFNLSWSVSLGYDHMICTSRLQVYLHYPDPSRVVNGWSYSRMEINARQDNSSSIFDNRILEKSEHHKMCTIANSCSAIVCTVYMPHMLVVRI